MVLFINKHVHQAHTIKRVRVSSLYHHLATKPFGASKLENSQKEITKGTLVCQHGDIPEKSNLD
jgi:hypothetical protein